MQNTTGHSQYMMDNTVVARLLLDLAEIKTKLSMKDDMMQIKNTLFYLPNYPRDLIQNNIVREANYWEYPLLETTKRYIPQNAVIMDIGANIGNHSLYWAVEWGAKKIYAFEPIKSTYEVLLKNIEINGLQEVIEPYNCGVSDENTHGEISMYNIGNIGGAHISKNPRGKIEMISIDSLKIKGKINFMKIDTEGSEQDVLLGAAATIKKNKPVIMIEIFDNNKTIVDTILKEFGYELKEILTPCDYIYEYAGKK